MIRRPPRSTRTDTLFPTRRSSDLKRVCAYSSDAKSCGDVVAGLGEIKRAQAKAEAEPREKRSEEHTSELQSLMRISYAVFCLKKKKKIKPKKNTRTSV